VGETRDATGLVRELVMLNAVPSEYVAHCREAFAAAGLTLASLEIEQLALVRGAVGPDQTPTLVLDIGGQSSGIMVAEKGQLVFAEQADLGGDTVTAALAGSLGVSPVRADAMKREHGLVGEGPGREMAAIAAPAVETLLGEVKKAIYTYESRFQRRLAAERVILTGAGANLRGIEGMLGNALQLPVARAAPLYRVEYPPGLEPLLPELNPSLALAVGLALPSVS
jgi:Tfp pilus assembly PilM family ATPase